MALPMRPHRGAPRARLPSPIDPALPETSCANRSVPALNPDIRPSATSGFGRCPVHPCFLGGPAWPRHMRTLVRDLECTKTYRAPKTFRSFVNKSASPVVLKCQWHQADHRIGPGDAALLRPAVAIEPDVFIRPGWGQRHALCPQPARLLGRRGTCRRDGIFHRMPISATTWKVREMGTPATIGCRHKNGEIVLHGPAPSTEHKTLNRQ